MTQKRVQCIGCYFVVMLLLSAVSAFAAWPTVPEDADNYAAALQKSIYFYLQQRTGELPADNPVIWRANSLMNDGADVGIDLTGGYLDAGDHVKFGLPMASTVATLALGVHEYKAGFQQNGQLDEILDAIKWGTDYFIKAHPAPNEFYFQIGDGGADHTWWGPVEVLDHVMERPSYKATRQHGGSAVCGATAVALTLASIIFEPTDAAYARQCLTHARQLVDLAWSAQSDEYYDSIAGNFYRSWSGFWDELATAGALLYMKTGDATYLEQAEEAVSHWGTEGQEPYWGYKWCHSWDDMHYIAQLLLARLTKKQVYIDSVERNLDYWLPGGGITYSPGGLAWLDSWGSLRYAANAAFLAFVWADSSTCTPSKADAYRKFAESQIDYIMGDNPRNGSYIIGFGYNAPQHPHHRTAHGSWANNMDTPVETRHVLYGALVGGPDANDGWHDQRNDYVTNEVACDYNAGLTSALARMTAVYGGQVHPDFPEGWFLPEEMRMPEFFTDARLNSEGPLYTEISVDLTNHSAWPARNGDQLSYRYYVDVSEVLEHGYSIADIVITQGYSEVSTTVTGPHHLSANIYYITVDYTGSNIFPAGQSESARETQVRIGLSPGSSAEAWDPTNDWSYQGLSNTRTRSEVIPVFEDGRLLFGRVPGNAEPETPPVIEENPSNYSVGDVNHDTVVNLEDAVSIARYYVGFRLAGFFTDTADINDDGSIDIVDALLTAQKADR